MPSFSPGVIYIFGLAGLITLQSCGQRKGKKLRALMDVPDILVNASANSTEAAPEELHLNYTWPGCKELNSETGTVVVSHGWRGEAQTAKNQLLEVIYQTGLSQEMAVQLALINNPQIFAYYENLEVAHAGLVEAGLRENPVIRKDIRFPNEPNQGINKEFEATINFLDFFLIPFRQNRAIAELQVIESEFRQVVLDLAKDVSTNWLSLKALELDLELENKRVEVKKLAADLSELQRKAGNISMLNALGYKTQYDETEANLKALLAKLAIAREKLNRSLGLFGPETCFSITSSFDWIKDAIPDLLTLEQAAVENRADMETLRREIFALAEEAKLKEPWTYSKLRIGTSSEKEPEGFTVTGPLIELEVPIYNFGQAEAQKYQALIRQAQQKLLAKAIEASSEIRELLATISILQTKLEDLEAKVLPDFEKRISEAQTHYNVMALGIYSLFELKEAEINASIEHVHTQENLLKAGVELFYAIGGSLAISGEKR